MIKVSFEARGSWHSRGETVHERHAIDSVRTFFRTFEQPPEEVMVVAYSAERGGHGSNPVRLVKTRPDARAAGVPVMIHVKGSQGLKCLMQVPGWTDEILEKVISEGPYLLKRKKRDNGTEPEVAATEPVEQAPETQVFDWPILAEMTADQEPIEVLEESTTLPEEHEAEVAMTTPVQPVVRQTPLEKLLKAKITQEDIERLRVTMATIVYREVGDTEIPNTLQVSVTAISIAAREHMQLPMNKVGDYRGIINNFYKSRIALFGYKHESSLDPDAQLTDWIIDADLVMDFVGDKNQLAALTRVRDLEVAARKRHEEEEAAAAPPPSAVAVEEATETGFLEAEALLNMATRTLEARRAAEEELRLARENAEQLAEEVRRREAALAEARLAHESSLALVAEAEVKVGEFVLGPDVIEKIRRAKQRLDALVADLGI
jgi:hypothetical protein